MKKKQFTLSVPGILCIVAVTIAALFLFAGCGETEGPAAIEEPTPAPTEEPTPEPTEVPYIVFSFGEIDRKTTELHLSSVTEDDLAHIDELRTCSFWTDASARTDRCLRHSARRSPIRCCGASGSAIR
jgi:hypothetical protein